MCPQDVKGCCAHSGEQVFSEVRLQGRERQQKIQFSLQKKIRLKICKEKAPSMKSK